MPATAVAATAKPAGRAPMVEEDSYRSVEDLRSDYINYLTIKQPEIEEQKTARRYYHIADWDAEAIEVLRKRGQPVISIPSTHKKINGICGIVQRMRQDPKAYPRTPEGEAGAELATATIRYVLDANDWKTIEQAALMQSAIEGIAGVELRLVEGDKGDPDIGMRIVRGDDFFYDPTSAEPDFSDANYFGIAKWLHVDRAVELFPDQEDEIRGLIDNGSDLTTNADREFKWVDAKQKRVRLVEEWYWHNGQWCWAFFVSHTILAEGASPFHDAKGESIPRLLMWSAAVDHDGDRYGFPRALKGWHDEVNQRRSKALHISNSRRLIVTKGAVDDIETTRREWARPDGIVEKNPAGEVVPDDTQADLAGQFQFLTEAKEGLEGYANVSLVNQSQNALTNLSGRAINLLQQPGLAELGPFIANFRGWKLRVYRAVFGAAQENWTGERHIRVTDDQDLAEFIQINGLDLDEWGRPMLVNALGALDVDIVLDEGPDVVSLMQDTYDVLKNQPPGTIPPQILIELSPMQASVKKKVLGMMQPPPPDPIAIQNAQLDLENKARTNELTSAMAGEKRASAVGKIAKAAEDASKAALNGAETYAAGLQALMQPAPAFGGEQPDQPMQQGMPPQGMQDPMPGVPMMEGGPPQLIDPATLASIMPPMPHDLPRPISEFAMPADQLSADDWLQPQLPL